MVSASNIINEIAVLVKDQDASNGAFTWLAPWRVETRLIPTRSLTRLGGTGSASFRMLRRRLSEQGTWATYPQIRVGAFIAISTGSLQWLNDPSSTAAEPLIWWGVITSVSGSTFMDEDDEVGTVEAQAYGTLLDRQRITGFKRVGASGGDGETLKTAPIANPSLQGELTIGNYTAAPTGALAGQFTRTNDLLSTTSAGSYWTRRRLLDHIRKYCVPAGLPPIRIFGNGASGYGTDTPSGGVLAVLDQDERISFDLSNLTFKGALDLLIPASRGLVWSLWPRNGYWLVWIDSTAPTTVGTLVANTQNDVELNDIPLVDCRYGEEMQYDSVTVEGAPIVHCFTIAYADGNMDRGWNATEQTAALAGASGESGYSGWTDAQKNRANREIRQTIYGHVWTRYVLKGDASTGDVKRKGTPGVGSGSDVVAMPTVTWDDATDTVALNASSDETPYLPQARFERQIPWQQGVLADVTDNRSAEQKAKPTYLPPRVFYYDSTQSTLNKWRDLNAIGDGFQGPQVDVDDRGAALGVTYSPPELLARTFWSTAAVTDLTPDPDYHSRSLFWQKLVFTVAMQSDQRLSVTQYGTFTKTDGTTGTFTAATARNPLILQGEHLKCWVVHAGTIIGLKAAAPDRVSATTFTRNDFPSAQLWCDAAAAYALTKRVAIELEMQRPDLTYTWAEPGEMVGDLIKRLPAAPGQTGTEIATGSGGSTRIVVNTTIDEVERIYSAEPGTAPRMIVRTMLAEIPQPGGGAIGGGSGGCNVSGGERVSVQLGGGPGATIKATKDQARTIVTRTQQVPVIPPRVLTYAPALRFIRIVGGNTLTTGQAGCKYSSSLISTVPSLYDPAVDSSYIDGICEGDLYIAGQTGTFLTGGRVLMVNDTRSPLATSLVADDVVYVGAEPITIPLVSDPTQYVTVYVPIFF